MIAKRRVDFVTGNINSYARILNDPAQLEKIKTYNQLSASIAELQRERDEQKETARVEKKKQDADKKQHVKEKERDAKDVHDRLLLLCQEHVVKDLHHVLSLNVKNSSTTLQIVKPDKMQILRHVFNHPEAKTGLKKARADELLTHLLSSPEGEMNDNALQANLDSNADNSGTTDDAVAGDIADVINFDMPELV